MLYPIHEISAHVSNISIIEYCLIRFSAALKPVLYNGPNVFDRSSIDLNIIPQSDSPSVDVNYIVDSYLTYPCSYLNQSFEYFSTSLTLKGVFGCSYRCPFVTKKSDYNNAYSKVCQLAFSKYSFFSFNSDCSKDSLINCSSSKTKHFHHRKGSNVTKI
jgi:hypothetical protein